MDVLSNEWWGEPLDAMMSRILVQELNQRLPGSTVYGDSGAISTPPDATVEINLQRFDLNRDGAVLLAAQIAVDAKRTASRGVAFTVRPADATTSGAGRGDEHGNGTTGGYGRGDAGVAALMSPRGGVNRDRNWNRRRTQMNADKQKIGGVADTDPNGMHHQTSIHPVTVASPHPRR